VVAGLAGISKPYLSQLETGHRRFERRSLLENLANALGCSVADLTGQPYLPGDRAGAEALTALPAISVALDDATLADVPDIPARDVAELARWAAIANEHTANNRYDQAGHELGTLLTELHVHAVTGDTDNRRQALAALTEACFVASGTARMLGNHDLRRKAPRPDQGQRTHDGPRRHRRVRPRRRPRATDHPAATPLDRHASGPSVSVLCRVELGERPLDRRRLVTSCAALGVVIATAENDAFPRD